MVGCGEVVKDGLSMGSYYNLRYHLLDFLHSGSELVLKIYNTVHFLSGDSILSAATHVAGGHDSLQFIHLRSQLASLLVQIAAI